jgi:hypothetical protein
MFRVPGSGQSNTAFGWGKISRCMQVLPEPDAKLNINVFQSFARIQWIYA